jgi:GTP cyclohydrolase II
MADPRAAARAIDALRRGWPVRVIGAEGALDLLAIESADAPRLAAFDPDSHADILLSASRAATLKLANQIDAAAPTLPVLIARSPWIDLAAAHALADPALDMATPLKGPFMAAACPRPDAADAALELARLAGLMPAFFARGDRVDVAAEVAAEAIRAHEDPARLRIAARAHLPVEACEQAEIVAFRNADDAAEHVALLIGTPDGTPPLVRLHSECITGDVLGSLKCDCGPQLHTALAEIAGVRWGILLFNKLRAYALQDQGFDTVDANLRLGFAIDARDYAVAARMLALLGQDRVRLLTNNPAKVAGLEAAGIAVAERVPHRLPDNPHNRAYLAAKRDRTGHQL